MTALEDLTGLVANLPGAELISSLQYSTALAGALVPDAQGVWPGLDGYVATYDVYFAAISLLNFLQAQPVVRQTSSEGTSVAVDAPNWAGLASYYASQSQISQWTSQDPLGVVYIYDGPHVAPTDMSGRRAGDDNVDTDVG